MAVTAGALSQVSVSSTTAILESEEATGGTGPYEYQWYRSTTSGFSPGGGNIIAGAEDIELTDTGLIPNTQYYYKVVVTDTGDSNVTSTSSQLAVATTAPVINPNQFAIEPYLGQVDMRYAYNTVSVQIGSTQSTALYPGAAVKMVDSAGGVPKVVACALATDEVLGFINYDIKSQTFPAGAGAQISMSGNVIFLYATAAISRGTRVVLDLSTNGGVKAANGSGGETIVGWAFDKASAAGELIRVFLMTPSFATDA
jgi:hypothetical protein